MTPDQINAARSTAVDSGVNPYVAVSSSNPNQAGNAVGPITPQSLTPVTPIVPPVTPPPTIAAGVTGASQAIIDQTKLDATLAADTAAKSTAVGTAGTGINALIDQISGVQSTRSAAEGDIHTPGTPAFNAETARVAGNNLLKSQQSQKAELEALQGSGLTDTQRASQSAEINRRYASEQSDYQLIYHLANSDYTAAENTLDNKMKLDLEPLQTKLTYLEEVQKNAQGSLTDSQNRQMNEMITEAKQNYDSTVQDKKDVADIITKLIGSKVKGVTPDLIVKLSNAKNGVSADKILAESGVDFSASDNGTVAERSAAALVRLSNAFVPGIKMPNGIPTVDANGNITPEAWVAAIKDAPAEGLTRAEFIKQFGRMIVGGTADAPIVSSKYGLTPVEKKTILGTL